MYIKCKSNAGFEDQLDRGVFYKVQALGENSYLIKNHKGQLRWYGRMHFEGRPYVEAE